MTFWTLLMRCLTSECVNRRTRKYSHTPRLLSTQYLETFLPHSRSRCVWEPWRWLSQILSTRLFCSLSTLGPCYRSVVSPLIIIDNLSHSFAFENMLIETNIDTIQLGKIWTQGNTLSFEHRTGRTSTKVGFMANGRPDPGKGFTRRRRLSAHMVGWEEQLGHQG